MKFSFLKHDGALAAGALLLAALWLAGGASERLEWRLYDFALGAAPERRADDDLVIVAIDDASLAALGAWPWNPARLADGIGRISAERPRAIGLVAPVGAESGAAALAELERLRSHVDPLAQPGLDVALAEAEAALDVQRPLADALRAAGNVVLALPEDAGDALIAPRAPAALPAELARHALASSRAGGRGLFDGFPDRLGAPDDDAAAGLHAVPGDVVAAAAAAGFVHGDARSTAGGARARPVLRAYGDAYLPSFALALAALIEGGASASAATALAGDRGAGFTLGGRPLRLDRDLRAHPWWYRAAGRPAFRVVSFHDVLAGRVPRGGFERQTVLIGLTATGLAPTQATPVDPALPAVLVEAHTVSALLAGDVVDVPRWGALLQLVLLAAFAAIAWTALARWRTRTALIVGAAVLATLAAVEFLGLVLALRWVPLLLPGAALLAATLALAVKRGLEGRTEAVRSALADANRVVAEAMHQKGEYDRALEKYLQCPPTSTLMERMYTLGLDFERGRQFNKAALVFDFIRRHDPKFSDVGERFLRNKQLENTVLLGGGGPGGVTSTQLTGANIAKPKLGRYEIERELGKGSHGTVYLGKDPRMGRTVAIKTLALAREFGPGDLEEVRMRFFREAEAAGRLSHTNIVTVYDCGEDRDLAWMAMDYLSGVPLVAHAKAGSLLPWDEAFAVCIQVAEALDYAHQQHVVHRDIKPANLIWDAPARRVRITDFGVACLTDMSKTQTGTILGSPSYMSPEQVSGRHVDGRSDLFSLGVTFYQLLTGELPFEAGQLAALMHKITSEPHTDIRAYNPRLPPCVGAIVDRALAKDPAARFATGGQMAEALRACRPQAPTY